jgi:integrase/recombinase XerC
MARLAPSAPASTCGGSHLTEYLAELAQRGLSGVTRARKVAALREFFCYLEQHDHLLRSPASGLTPKRKKKVPTYLRPDEYSRMLSLAGGAARDYAILQVFLQTGLRVGELRA